MATVAVTDDTFDAEVRQSDVPVVVDFWAEWCGPCKMIGPALEELSNEYGDQIKIAKVNVDETPNWRSRYPGAVPVQGWPGRFEQDRRRSQGRAQGLDRRIDLKPGRLNSSRPPTVAAFSISRRAVFLGPRN